MNENQIKKEVSLKLSSIEIFDANNPDINWKRFYCAHFQCIPSSKSLKNMDVRRLIDWFENNKSDRILKRHVSEQISDNGKPIFQKVVYIMDNDCIVVMENHLASVKIYYSNKPEEAQNLVGSIRKFKNKSSGSRISVVVHESHGLWLASLKFKKPKCTIEKNYNNDLAALHGNIIQTLRRRNTCGLTLFHGAPGTGKSTYIRFLIGLVNKKVIFLPPKLAANMDDPEITTLLIENPGTIMIIEDAEDLLISRDAGNNSAISMLLNLTDGLLGVSLGIQFICTFNTNVDNIDKALLRKGRLTTLYEFKPLSEIKAKELLIDIGVKNYVPTHPMTLAEIYFVDQREFEYERKLNPIGFDSRVA